MRKWGEKLGRGGGNTGRGLPLLTTAVQDAIAGRDLSASVGGACQRRGSAISRLLGLIRRGVGTSDEATP